MQTDLAIGKFYHCDNRWKLLNLQWYKTLKIFLKDQFQICIKHVIEQRLHTITQMPSEEQNLWFNQGTFLPNINVTTPKGIGYSESKTNESTINETSLTNVSMHFI